MKRYVTLMALTLLALLILALTAAGAVKIIIRSNANSQTTSDVLLKESKTGRITKFLTINDVYRQHYHAAEYHNGHLYVIIRPGGVSNFEKKQNRPNELWRYDQNGKGTKLWPSDLRDFRIRDDEGLIAVISSSQRNESNPSPTLYLLGPDGKLKKAFPYKEPVWKDIAFEIWAGRYLWLNEYETVDIHSFFRIDTKTMAAHKYDISHLNLTCEDYDLNTASLLLAYSDYPPMFDAEDYREFKSRRTPVKLYVYDLGTKRRRFIARAVAESFSPKWVDAVTLEYKNPRGAGRIRKRIR